MPHVSGMQPFPRERQSIPSGEQGESNLVVVREQGMDVLIKRD